MSNNNEYQYQRFRRVVKWVIYPLLLLNVFVYGAEDLARATEYLGTGDSLLDWSIEFASTIDSIAFLALIAMLELETTVLLASATQSFSRRLVRFIRLLCFVAIAHGVYAYGVSVYYYEKDLPPPEISSLCEIAEQDVSFVYNLRYTRITNENCGTLTQESEFYYLGEEWVVTTATGLTIERAMGWSDVADITIWILIILSIELIVGLQGRRITGGALFRNIYTLKIGLYTSLFLLAAFWAYMWHWLYIWDQFLWVGAFIAIEMNISKWRNSMTSTAA